MHLKSTKCDNCIVATMVAAQYLACIVSCVAMCVDVPGLRETAHALDLAADIAWCSVCACMQTQHKVQLDARDAGRARAPTGVGDVLEQRGAQILLPARTTRVPRWRSRAHGAIFCESTQLAARGLGQSEWSSWSGCACCRSC